MVAETEAVKLEPEELDRHGMGILTEYKRQENYCFRRAAFAGTKFGKVRNCPIESVTRQGAANCLYFDDENISTAERDLNLSQLCGDDWSGITEARPRVRCGG